MRKGFWLFRIFFEQDYRDLVERLEVLEPGRFLAGEGFEVAGVGFGRACLLDRDPENILTQLFDLSDGAGHPGCSLDLHTDLRMHVDRMLSFNAVQIAPVPEKVQVFGSGDCLVRSTRRFVPVEDLFHEGPEDRPEDPAHDCVKLIPPVGGLFGSCSCHLCCLLYRYLVFLTGVLSAWRTQIKLLLVGLFRKI